jgi:fucose 4-O-acetylase-like acetyltransferase
VSPERVARLETAKFLLIFLVVLGHAVEPLIHQIHGMKALYVFIYAFHMPAFVAISGHLSKAKPDAAKLIQSLIIPYLVFQILYRLFDAWVVRKDPVELELLTPYWILWFLVSLFAWRGALPYVMRFRAPLVVALILSLGAGYSPQVGYFLSLSRIAAFLPFFVAGYLVPTQWVQREWPIGLRVFAAVHVVGCLVAAWFVAAQLDVRWLYGSYSYAGLGAGQWFAGAYRLGWILAGLSLTAAVLILIPARSLSFSSLGGRSLNVFLLHGFIVKAAVAYGLFKHAGTLGALPALVACSAAVTWLLSLGWVERVLAPLVSPRWLSKRLIRSGD